MVFLMCIKDLKHLCTEWIFKNYGWTGWEKEKVGEWFSPKTKKEIKKRAGKTAKERKKRMTAEEKEEAVERKKGDARR